MKLSIGKKILLLLYSTQVFFLFACTSQKVEMTGFNFSQNNPLLVLNSNSNQINLKENSSYELIVESSDKVTEDTEIIINYAPISAFLKSTPASLIIKKGEKKASTNILTHILMNKQSSSTYTLYANSNSKVFNLENNTLQVTLTSQFPFFDFQSSNATFNKIITNGANYQMGGNCVGEGAQIEFKFSGNISSNPTSRSFTTSCLSGSWNASSIINVFDSGSISVSGTSTDIHGRTFTLVSPIFVTLDKTPPTINNLILSDAISNKLDRSPKIKGLTIDNTPFDNSELKFNVQIGIKNNAVFSELYSSMISFNEILNYSFTGLNLNDSTTYYMRLTATDTAENSSMTESSWTTDGAIPIVQEITAYSSEGEIPTGTRTYFNENNSIFIKFKFNVGIKLTPSGTSGATSVSVIKPFTELISIEPTPVPLPAVIYYPTLCLNINNSEKEISYDAASSDLNNGVLSFKYFVQASDNSEKLSYCETRDSSGKNNSIDTKDYFIQSLSGQMAIPDLPSTTDARSLKNKYNITIDTLKPNFTVGISYFDSGFYNFDSSQTPQFYFTPAVESHIGNYEAKIDICSDYTCSSTTAFQDYNSVGSINGLLYPNFDNTIYSFSKNYSLTPNTYYQAVVRAIDLAGNISNELKSIPWKTISQGITENENIIRVPGVEIGDNFSYGSSSSVDQDGDTLVIGAPNEDSSTTSITNAISTSALLNWNYATNNTKSDSGAVYVYTKKNGSWEIEALIKPPISQTNLKFGTSVSISGDFLAVGAPGYSLINSNGGATYIFKRINKSWNYQASVRKGYILPENSIVGSFCGSSVSIKKNVLAIGCPFDTYENYKGVIPSNTLDISNSASTSGAVYVYHLEPSTFEWNFKYLIKPNLSTYYSNYQFGSHIKLTDSFLAISTIGDKSKSANTIEDVSGTNVGSVFVYSMLNGVPANNPQYIKSPDYMMESSALFGKNTLIENDFLIISSGSQSKKIGDFANPDSSLNSSLAVTTSSVANRPGSVFIYKLDSNNQFKFHTGISSFFDTDSEFGKSISFKNNILSIAAPKDNLNSNSITPVENFSTLPLITKNSAQSGAIYHLELVNNHFEFKSFIKPNNNLSSNFFGSSTVVNSNEIISISLDYSKNAAGETLGILNSFNIQKINKPQFIGFGKKVSNTQNNLQLGSSIDIDKNLMVVGAPNSNDSSITIQNLSVGLPLSENTSGNENGAVYVYRKINDTSNDSQWNLEAFLKPSNSFSNIHFGEVISINNDTIAVGVPNDSNDGNQILATQVSNQGTTNKSGAVIVFKKSNGYWVQEAFIKAPNSHVDLKFGSSVDIFNDTLVVGAPGDKNTNTSPTKNEAGITSLTTNNSGNDIGSIYIYRRTLGIWKLVSYIRPSIIENQINFGQKVAIDNGYIVTSAPNYNSNKGKIYIYKDEFISTTARFISSIQEIECPTDLCSGTSALFGSSIDIQDNKLAIGAPGDLIKKFSIANPLSAELSSWIYDNRNAPKAASNQEKGAVYIYELNYTNDASTNNFQFKNYIKSPVSDSITKFGKTIKLYNDTLLVGLENESSNITSSLTGNKLPFMTSIYTNNWSTPNSGAVVMFKEIKSDNKTSWIQNAYLKPHNNKPNLSFGKSIGIYENNIVVGAPGESSDNSGFTQSFTPENLNLLGVNSNKTNSGAFYLFTK